MSETNPSREDRVNVAIAEFLNAVDCGQAPSQEKFLADHADIAPELKLFFADQLRVQQAAKEERRHVEDGLTQTYVPRDAGPGSVIAGRYTLIEPIGEGGMGTVWIAKQTDPVKRKVALKLIKAGMDSKAVIQRFEQERQALALMDHPNIAKVLDGGITDEGRPYFVMELVNGLPLTKFCDESLLTPRERLELFVPICQAVQHAHQKGIVHRDLKPANILVAMIDGKPVPKVIDFGVAKATGGKLTDESMSTQFGAVVGTLEYMSPEQAGFSGVDVDTRADIYSLGVILYELLTGLRPIDAKRLKKGAMIEMIRIIQEEDPSKPSTRLSTDASLPSQAALRHIEPRKLMAMLRGELDWVVMKCLEKHRERRYETANGLAKDIQRFLENEPVEARPPTAAYRFTKFWCRNKGSVLTTASLVLTVLFGVAAVMTVQARSNRDLEEKNSLLATKNIQLADEQAKVQAKIREVADEQAKVQQRFDLALKAIATFHTGVSEDVLLQEEKFNELRNSLLKEAAGFYGQLEKLLEGQTDGRSRRALGAAFFQLGDLTDKIGLKPEALEVHRKGLAVRRELSTAADADIETQLDVPRSLLRVGQLLNATGKTTEALATYEEQRDIAEKLAQKYLTDAARATLAHCYLAIGALLKETGRPPEARTNYERALSILQNLVDANPSVTRFQSDLAGSQSNFGLLLHETGKPVEAMTAYAKARSILQKLVETKPAVSDYLVPLALVHNNIGKLLLESGKPAEGLAEIEIARGIFQKLADARSAVTDYQYRLGMSHRNIGKVLDEMSRMDEALSAFENARDIRQKLVDSNPSVTKFQSDLAETHVDIGWFLTRTGRPAEAMLAYQRARDILQKLVDADSGVTRVQASLALVHINLGKILEETGKRAEGLAEMEVARGIFQKLADANPDVTQFRARLAMSHHNIGVMLTKAGKPDLAMPAHQKALVILQKLVGEDPANPSFQSELAECHHYIGALYIGKPVEAMAAFEQARANLQKLVDANADISDFQNRLARVYLDIGKVLFETGKPAEALLAFEQARTILEKLANANPNVTAFQVDLARSLGNISVSLTRIGEPSRAIAAYEKALAIQQKLADNHPSITQFQSDLALTHNNMGLLLRGAQKGKEAMASLEHTRAILEKLADSNPAIADFQDRLALVHTDIALILLESGRTVDWLPAFEQALAIRRKLAVTYPTVNNFQIQLANCLDGIGWLLTQAGQPLEAIPYYTQEETVWRQLCDTSPVASAETNSLANCQTNLSDALRKTKRLEDAQAACDRALALREPLVNANPQDVGYRVGLAETYLRAGQVKCETGDLASGASAWRRAIALFDGLPSLKGEPLFLRACCHAAISGLSGQSGSNVSAEQATTESELALDWLRQAALAGHTNPDAYRTESALDPLRDREDFKKLINELEAKTSPN